MHVPNKPLNGPASTTGAVVGFVGRMVTALVFGGNVGEAAAGAMSGAVADSNQKKSQAEAEMQGAMKKLADIRQKYNLPKECG